MSVSPMHHVCCESDIFLSDPFLLVGPTAVISQKWENCFVLSNRHPQMLKSNLGSKGAVCVRTENKTKLREDMSRGYAMSWDRRPGA